MSGAEQKAPSVEVLLGCGWEEVVSSSHSRDCFYYAGVFAERAESAADAGGETKAAALRLWAAVTAPRLSAEAGREPYEELDEVRALSKAELAVLQSVQQQVIDPELKARIGDMLFVRDEAPYGTRLATIEALLQSADQLFGDPRVSFWPFVFRVNRALAVAVSLGRTHPECDKVVHFIESTMERHFGEPHNIVVLHLMGVLQQFKLGDCQSLAHLARKMGFALEADGRLLEGGEEHVKAQGEFYEAKQYWEVEGRWWEIVGAATLARSAKLRAAASHVLCARNWVTVSPPSFMNASVQIEEAIAEFRQIGGCKEITDELQVQLVGFQDKARNEGIRISTPVDFERWRKEAREAVSGKNWEEALATLVNIRRPPTHEELEEEIREEAKATPLLFLLASTKHGEKGGVTGRSASVLSEDEKEVEEALRNKLFERAREHQITDAEVLIDAARGQIVEEHDVDVEKLLENVGGGPFVPPGHGGLVAHGLHAGFQGDFPGAAHLLAPQVEAGLRYLLFQRGVITTGYDQDGIQDEFSLNRLLQAPELAKELEAILGVETVFDLRGLLVERYGSNLRNRVAHGLLTEESAGSCEVKYLWWCVLRLSLLKLDPHAMVQG